MIDDTTRADLGRSRSDAAERIRRVHGIPCTAGTLATMAWAGRGPIYRHVCGRAVYRDDDIDAWAATRISAPTRKAADLRRREPEAA